MKTMDRKVLMVSAAFPPIGGSGVQRSLKFARYLPQFGWRPIVWCLDEMNGLPTDATLLDELPASVERLPASSLLYGGRHRPAGMLATWPQRLSRWSTAVKWRTPADEPTPFPDEFAPLAAACVEPLIRRMETENIELIYATFSPPANLWLGLTLHEETGRPWVADFRDLWIDDCRYAESSPGLHARRRGFLLRVLESADAVIGVSESQTRILAKYLPGQARKFLTITNGFDPADFAAATPSRRPDGRFVLTHVGRLDRWRASGPFLKGIRKFVQEKSLPTESFELRLVGHVNREWQHEARGMGLPVACPGPVSHGEAIRYMQEADVLLLPLPEGPNAETVIAAKVFEYLAARRPILVVGPRGGETERVVRKAGAGLCVTHDETAIANALTELCKRIRNGDGAGAQVLPDLASFSRVELTRRLAERFDDVAGPKPSFLKAPKSSLRNAQRRAPQTSGAGTR